MTAGRGWIALALVVFATWKPLRVLVGAYLFGGVTLAQFPGAGLGRADRHAVAVPVDAAVCRDDRRARDHLARRADDPAQRAGLARPAVPPRRRERGARRGMRGWHPAAPSCNAVTVADPHRVCTSGDIAMQRMSTQTGARGVIACAIAVRCSAAAQAGRRAAQGRLRLREPDRRRRLDVPARQGRKEMEKALGGKVTTKYVENVPEGADAERVIRELAQTAHAIIFTTSFGYMNPTSKVAKQFPKVDFEHATGYKSGPNVGIYNARFYEGRYLAGVIAGKMTKIERPGLRRRVSDSRSRAWDQRVRARHAQRQPEGRGAGHLDQLVVRPGQGARGGEDADLAGRRRADASHRFDRRRAGRRGEGQVRVRLPLRHVEVRPEGAAHGDDAPVGRLLHEGGAAKCSTARGSPTTSGAASRTA